jgi:NAD(P)-dependent dehydrogenase (short-subunit alcohol dehydrogenase family)
VPTALVTGANRGLGLAFVRAYASRGFRVHACCRQPEQAHQLRRLAGDITLHRWDARDPTAARMLADRLAGEGIDHLIACAAIAGPNDPPEALDVPAWFETLLVNCIAPLQLAAALSRHVAQSHERKIIAISSSLASIGDNRTGGLWAYRCSKAALNMAWRNLAIDLRGAGIICALLDPGWVRTAMGGPAAPLSPEESVRGMLAVIDRLRPEDSGSFLSWRGELRPW